MNIYNDLEEVLDPLQAVNFADGLLDNWMIYDASRDHRKENAIIVWAYDSREKGTGGRYVCQVTTPDGMLNCQIASAIVKGLELLRDKRQRIIIK